MSREILSERRPTGSRGKLKRSQKVFLGLKDYKIKPKISFLSWFFYY